MPKGIVQKSAKQTRLRWRSSVFQVHDGIKYQVRVDDGQRGEGWKYVRDDGSIFWKYDEDIDDK